MVSAASLKWGGPALRSGKSGAVSRNPSMDRFRSGSRDLVNAWGQMRGQSSVDFARMLQRLDDEAFDAEHERFSRQQ